METSGSVQTCNGIALPFPSPSNIPKERKLPLWGRNLYRPNLWLLFGSTEENQEKKMATCVSVDILTL
jgi:hypothetical protein